MTDINVIQPNIEPEKEKGIPESDGEVTQTERIDFDNDYRVVDILEYFDIPKNDLTDDTIRSKVEEIYKTIIPFGNDYMMVLRDMGVNLGQPMQGSKLDQVFNYLRLQKQARILNEELRQI